MKLQKKILLRYLNLNNGPTLKQVSEDTGIQMTRIFRILNGSSMKLSEYEILRKKISDKLGLAGVLENLVHECTQDLSNDVLVEIEHFLQRKIDIWKIKQIQKNINETVVA